MAAVFEVKASGDGKILRRLFRTRAKRIERMQREMVLEVMDKFKEDVKSKLPNTPEMKAYHKAIQRREIAASYKHGEFGYALIAVPEEMELKDLNPKSTAVYVVSKAEAVGDLGQLLIDLGPWVVDRLPSNLPEREVKLIHRNVTEDEVVRLREKNDTVLKERKADFDKAGAKFEKKEGGEEQEDLDPPKSLPDLAFTAIRMEFGIKMRQTKHWGHAVGQIEGHLEDMIRGGGEYRKYIADPYFGEWNSPMKKIDKVTGQDFVAKYKQFQDKVV